MENCCFTGHRTIPLQELPALTAHVDEVIRTLYGAGCRRYYTGGAVGFDTLAACRVLLLREECPDARLYLLLPCRDQHHAWPPSDIRRYEDILRGCDGFHYVEEAYSPHVMAARNMELIAHADVLVAYARRYASGAGQTVRAAEREGIPVLNLADRITAESSESRTKNL